MPINKPFTYNTPRPKVWSVIGNKLENSPKTALEVLEQCDLNFEVALAETYAKFAPTKDKPRNGKLIPNVNTIYRTDNESIFGICSDRYEIIQNNKAFEFFDNIVGEGKAIYETAGSLYGGRVTFITAKLPKLIQVHGKDNIEEYLLFTNSHDGTTPVTIMFTPIRVVCENTLHSALSGAGARFTAKHTKSIVEKLDLARTILGITTKKAEELSQLFEVMSNKNIQDWQLKNFVHATFLTEKELTILAKTNSYEAADISTKKLNIIDSVLDYAENGIGQRLDTTKGTVFGAYNAITGYFQNVSSIKDHEKQYESIISGNAFNYTKKAFELSLSMIK
jgi:phage/plasmid-like protein (TIGR03299 family)